MHQPRDERKRAAGGLALARAVEHPTIHAERVLGLILWGALFAVILALGLG